MPDPTSQDPFADLFGKLPDPRARRIDGESGASEPLSAAQGDDAPPLSRRAAREAANASATGEQAVVPPAPVSTTPAVDTPRPAAETPSVPTPSVPAPAVSASTASAGAASTVQAPARPVGDPAGAYARTGTTATIPPADPVAGLDDLFTGARSTDDLGSEPVPKNKRRRRIGGWIALGVVLVILGGIAGGGWYVWNTYEDKIREFMGWEEPKDFEEGLANGEAVLTIVSGDTGQSISPKLFEAGVTKSEDAFYDYLVEENLNPPFVPGAFQLKKQMSSAAALAAILDPANKLEDTAQLREGLTVAQSLPILADGIGVPLADLQAAVANPADFGVAADSLEGWLFPATYTFSPGITAHDVIQTLVNRTVQSLDSAGVPEADRQRILTVASIIQREARFEADMKKVATVIQNRLDPSNQETFGLLQMDSTAQYGYGEMHDGSVSSSEAALNDDNPWNTYMHTGLPIGPISNPGDVAISAAMNPEPGPWLYFVTVDLNSGETVFTTNLADHNRAVAQWINWCKANPDAGC